MRYYWGKITAQVDLLNRSNEFDFTAVVASVLFLLILLFVPSVKIFFVIAFLFFGWLVFYYGFAKAFIYITPILTHINFGQVHQVLVIPPDAIMSAQYLEGKHLSWSINPYLIITLVASLFFFWWRKKNHQKTRISSKNKILTSEKFLLMAISSGILSALYGAIIPGISIYTVISSLLGLSWLLYLVNLGQKSTIAWKKTLLTFWLITILLLFYEALIVAGQMLFEGTVGLFIEGTQIAPVFGLGADETRGSFRPFGLSGHPNGLASYFLLRQILINFLYFYLKNLKPINKKFWGEVLTKILIIANFAAIIVIILTLSRATYLALFIVGTFITLRQPQLIRHLKKQLMSAIHQIQPRHWLVILFLIVVLTFKLTTRLFNSIYSLSATGGVTTRWEQYQEAWRVFLHSPFWGIGDNMFIATSYQLFPQGVMTYFPENVHNGFLLLLTERGLLGFGLYTLFLIAFIRSIIQSSFSKLHKTLLYSGIITGFVIMIFHPVIYITSLPISLGIAIIHYEKT